MTPRFRALFRAADRQIEGRCQDRQPVCRFRCDVCRYHPDDGRGLAYRLARLQYRQPWERRNGLACVARGKGGKWV